MQSEPKANITTYFPSYQQLKEKKITQILVCFMKKDIKKAFQERFKDFEFLKLKLALFYNPIDV